MSAPANKLIAALAVMVGYLVVLYLAGMATSAALDRTGSFVLITLAWSCIPLVGMLALLPLVDGALSLLDSKSKRG
jgi:hypothetical protein